MSPRFSVQEPLPAERSAPPGGRRASQSDGDEPKSLASSAQPPRVPVPETLLGHPRSFRDSFCRRFEVVPERYTVEMLRRCLSRRARLAAPLIRWFSPHHFSVDELFIQCIGRARCAEEFEDEVKAFRAHAANRRWLRRVLKLRLSVWRVFDVADEVLPHLKPESRITDSRPPWN